MEKELFVKIEEYEDIKDILKLVQGKISDAHKTLGKIQNLREREADELSKWKSEIDNVEGKVDFIANSIVGLTE